MNKSLFYIFLTFGLFSCSSDGGSDFNGNSSDGIAGSLAQFITVGNYFYAIDRTDLKVFDISDVAQMNQVNDLYLGEDIETIFPYNNHLFFGTNSGLIIYDIEDQANPKFVSRFDHIVACDPVTVNGRYAYVTLRTQGGPTNSTANCWGNVDELQVVDIEDLLNPQLVNRYFQTSPIGLSSNDSTLFVCDMISGLHQYDLQAAPTLELEQQYQHIKAHDLIIKDDLLILISELQLDQYQIHEDTLLYVSELELR